MPALLRSHRLPRHPCGAAAICLALIASGCGGGGYGGSSGGGNYNNPVPVISGLSPASASAGAAALQLTINGSNFMSSSTVTYDGVAHPATIVSASELTIQLSVADLALAGSYPVIVTNPPPGGGASTPVPFVVGNPVPAITGVSPALATAGAMAQTLTINGSGFMSSSTVTYNGTVHTATFGSATQLTIQLTAADEATVGNYPVIVTNPTPGGGASNTATFSVTPVLPAAATVLILGGQTVSSTPLASAEVFAAASSSFSGAGTMRVARYRPTASLVSTAAGAAILIAGGLDASGTGIPTAETYQVAGKTFGAATLGMQCAHVGHTATVLQNGKVLIAGRVGTTIAACAELYDPATATFTPTGSMKIPVSNHAAVLLSNGKVLIVGGTADGTSCRSCVSTNSAELYDPTTGTFVLTGSLTSGRSSPTATLLPSGQVLITGGGVNPTSGPLRTAELYDPVAGTFSSIASTMTVERQFHTATLLTTGQVLLVGGLTKVGAVATASADLYDPSTNTFHATGAMTSARLYHTATDLGNGVILVAGGITSPTGMGESTAELYDPTTGVFTPTGGLATGRYGAAASPLQ
jgi:hypothetical protein